MYLAIAPARSWNAALEWVLKAILFVYIPGMCDLRVYHRMILTHFRLVRAVHAHDGTETESHEGLGVDEDRVKAVTVMQRTHMSRFML